MQAVMVGRMDARFRDHDASFVIVELDENWGLYQHPARRANWPAPFAAYSRWWSVTQRPPPHRHTSLREPVQAGVRSASDGGGPVSIA